MTTLKASFQPLTEFRFTVCGIRALFLYRTLSPARTARMRGMNWQHGVSTVCSTGFGFEKIGVYLLLRDHRLHVVVVRPQVDPDVFQPAGFRIDDDGFVEQRSLRQAMIFINPHIHKRRNDRFLLGKQDPTFEGDPRLITGLGTGASAAANPHAASSPAAVITFQIIRGPSAIAERLHLGTLSHTLIEPPGGREEINTIALQLPQERHQVLLLLGSSASSPGPG